MPLGSAALVPLVLLGGASVLYWALTDDLTPCMRHGEPAWPRSTPLHCANACRLRFDSRADALVQGLPLLLVPVLLFAFEPRYSHSAAYICALGLYAAAKVTELRDREIFDATGHRVSGHTLKHLLSGAATIVFYALLVFRTPLDSAGVGDACLLWAA